MTPEDVKKYYGNSYNFKKKTGMSDATFRNWIRWGFVPEESQHRLERLTKGELKYSRQKTAEDDKWRHSHLGDGVYAFFDDYGIRLRSNDHRKAYCDDEIYLEPEILDRLNAFNNEMRSKSKDGK